MRNNKYKLKRITVVSALCFSVLYTNTASSAYPVTNYTLDPYLMGFTSGNGLIETLVSMNDMRIRRMLLSVMPVRQSKNSV